MCQACVSYFLSSGKSLMLPHFCVHPRCQVARLLLYIFFFLFFCTHCRLILQGMSGLSGQSIQSVRIQRQNYGMKWWSSEGKYKRDWKVKRSKKCKGRVCHLEMKISKERRKRVGAGRLVWQPMFNPNWAKGSVVRDRGRECNVLTISLVSPETQCHFDITGIQYQLSKAFLKCELGKIRWSWTKKMGVCITDLFKMLFATLLC